jgi:hypothetical protein
VRATRAHLSARPHSRQHAVVFDDPMVKRPRDMQRDDRGDQYAADEMPDKDPVRKRHILGGDRRKGKQPENADGPTARLFGRHWCMLSEADRWGTRRDWRNRLSSCRAACFRIASREPARPGKYRRLVRRHSGTRPCGRILFSPMIHAEDGVHTA